MRLAIVFDNFGPYHVARMAAAAQYCDVFAVEVSPRNSEYAWESPDLPENLQYISLSTGTGDASDAAALLRTFDTLLTPLALDCIAVPGWSSVAALALTQWCVKRDIPVVCMSETNGWDFARSWPTELVKKGVVGHFSSALVTSDSQARYMETLGMSPQAVFRGYNIVDNDYFAASAKAIQSTGAMPMIDNKLIPASWRNRYFLASNRFIEKKNLPLLLGCYAAFRQGRSHETDDWPLVMLGDGEMRSELEDLSKSLGLDSHVYFPGFRQYDELPTFYATAGAFVHVSTTEQWGLVINEAMASGLPAIVSKRCGCAEVLIDDGKNGLIIDPYDAPGIAAALTQIADPVRRDQLAAQASIRISEWGPDKFATGLRDAADFAANQCQGHPNLLDRQCLKLAIIRLA